MDTTKCQMNLQGLAKKKNLLEQLFFLLKTNVLLSLLWEEEISPQIGK